ncbi:MAG: ABC transporter substrate-binding protein [Deltaproteobacteria bacterium]|nr:ABC transporter substrate-binding protein [Deltaproteobacteria bacterium]
MRRRLIVAGAVAVWLAAFPATGSAQLKKITLGAPTMAITEVPFKIARAKGFYREEGLDLDLVLIRGALGVKAIMGGSVDYTTASGSIIAAAIRGIGVKLVLLISSKPAFDLVSDAHIRSVAELRGKTVGISSRGGSVDLLTRLVLERNGLSPDRDVTLIEIGRQEEMIVALKTGRISAALLSPPRNLLLYREKFTKLAYVGDYMPAAPTGGIGLTDEKLRKNRGEVLAFVRGTLKGLKYYRQNRSESVKLIAKELRLDDTSLAAEIFDWHGGQLARNGAADEAWMRAAIDFTKKSIGVKEEIPTRQVFDFSFIEKALR